jgi:hypothetical protein
MEGEADEAMEEVQQQEVFDFSQDQSKWKPAF